MLLWRVELRELVFLTHMYFTPSLYANLPLWSPMAFPQLYCIWANMRVDAWMVFVLFAKAVQHNRKQLALWGGICPVPMAEFVLFVPLGNKSFHHWQLQQALHSLWFIHPPIHTTMEYRRFYQGPRELQKGAYVYVLVHTYTSNQQLTVHGYKKNYLLLLKLPIDLFLLQQLPGLVQPLHSQFFYFHDVLIPLPLPLCPTSSNLPFYLQKLLLQWCTTFFAFSFQLLHSLEAVSLTKSEKELLLLLWALHLTLLGSVSVLLKQTSANTHLE